jgi:subfamily B ATP-binding cassette protein MsbA
MNKLKRLVVKYFGHFVFFYRYLRYRIFVSLALSLLVGLLDSIGLVMFIPLLQIVIGDSANPGEGLGGMRFIVDGFNYVGLPFSLGSVLFLMGIIFLLKAVLKFSQMYYNILVRLYFIRSIRFKMSDRLANFSYKEFVLADAGRIQNTMSGEVGRVTQAYNSYFTTVSNWVFLLVYFGMALITNAQFSILVLVGGYLSNLIYKRIYVMTKENSAKITLTGHIFQRLLIQNVAFFKYLKATGFIKAYNKKLRQAILTIEDANRKIGFYGAILGSSREPVVFVVIAIVIFVQATVIQGNSDGIIPSLLFFYRALTYILSIQTSWNGFLGASGALSNVTQFLKDLENGQEKYGPKQFNKFTKSIEVQQVDFYYGQTRILNEVSLSIPKNKTIAFVGESGSGKTTMVNLLCGLMPVDGGKIEIDGTRYRDLDLRTLQQRIGYITQDPVIFSDSVFDNITQWAPKTEANLARFWQACEQAAIAKFIRSLDKKEDSELGNNGIQVSGGQKQRISIARELFKEIDILVMDEATSALDSEVERAIQDNIDALKGNYTIIIVAHRLSTVKDADLIFVLNKGSIEASGNFEKLIGESPRFKRMVELQEF